MGGMHAPGLPALTNEVQRGIVSSHMSQLQPPAQSAPTRAEHSAGGVAPLACLNCAATIAGAYCAACGQRVIDVAAPSWHVIREAVADATDLDGRVRHTLRAIVSPGRLTVEFLRGRRAPYIGPLKLFLLAGAALTTTWVLTRTVDGQFYGYDAGGAAEAYIATVVRGSFAAALGIAVASWVLAGRRRRLIDDVVFALHLVAALSLLAAVVIGLAAMWKMIWGTDKAVPRGVPSIIYLLFLPQAAVSLAYIVSAVRRVHGGAWWTVALRAIMLTTTGIAIVLLALRARGPA